MDHQQIELSNAIAGIIMNADYSFFSNKEKALRKPEDRALNKNSTYDEEELKYISPFLFSSIDISSMISGTYLHNAYS